MPVERHNCLRMASEQVRTKIKWNGRRLPNGRHVTQINAWRQKRPHWPPINRSIDSPVSSTGGNEVKVFLVLAIAVISATAHAQEQCSSIISFSRVSSSSVADSSAFDQEAATFCSAYSRNSSTSSDTNFAASHKFLSASFGQENASTESIASKVCSASNRSVARSDAYKQYVESVAPGAFDAYAACVKAKDSLQFAVPAASMLPTEFTVSARFVLSASGAKAELKHTPSDGVACGWNNSNAQSVTLRGGDSTTLRCKRTDATKQAYVTIINAAGTEQLTIPWKRYTAAGNPVDNLSALTADLMKAQATLVALQTSINAIQAEAARQGAAIGQTSQTLSSRLNTAESRIAAVDSKTRWKAGNDGCASCNRFCRESQFEGWSGVCVAATGGTANEALPCDKQPYGGPVHCMCAAR